MGVLADNSLPPPASHTHPVSRYFHFSEKLERMLMVGLELGGGGCHKISKIDLFDCKGLVRKRVSEYFDL